MRNLWPVCDDVYDDMRVNMNEWKNEWMKSKRGERKEHQYSGFQLTLTKSCGVFLQFLAFGPINRSGPVIIPAEREQRVVNHPLHLTQDSRASDSAATKCTVVHFIFVSGLGKRDRGWDGYQGSHHCEWETGLIRVTQHSYVKLFLGALSSGNLWGSLHAGKIGYSCLILLLKAYSW